MSEQLKRALPFVFVTRNELLNILQTVIWLEACGVRLPEDATAGAVVATVEGCTLRLCQVISSNVTESGKRL
jgi:hypothetical protein